MKINLLPTTEKALLHRRYYARMLFVGCTLFAGVVVFSALALLPSIVQLRSAVSTHRPPEVANTTSATSTLATVTAEIKEVNAKIAIVQGKDLLAEPAPQTVVMARIIDAVLRARTAAKAKVTITSWQFSRQAGSEVEKTPAGHSLSLSGVAASREVLRELVKELTTTEGVTSVENPISNFVPGKNLSFTILVLAH